ncbi:unnamed protein product, partial [Closterium sp. NIES-54]
QRPPTAFFRGDFQLQQHSPLSPFHLPAPRVPVSQPERVASTCASIGGAHAAFPQRGRLRTVHVSPLRPPFPLSPPPSLAPSVPPPSPALPPHLPASPCAHQPSIPPHPFPLSATRGGGAHAVPLPRGNRCGYRLSHIASPNNPASPFLPPRPTRHIPVLALHVVEGRMLHRYHQDGSRLSLIATLKPLPPSTTHPPVSPLTPSNPPHPPSPTHHLPPSPKSHRYSLSDLGRTTMATSYAGRWCTSTPPFLLLPLSPTPPSPPIPSRCRLHVVEGRMQYLYDEDGRRYLDAFAGIVTVSVGHCHPAFVEAVGRQNALLQHTTSIYLNHQIAEYAEELAAKMPGNLKNVYFVNSGSEANDMALTMARLFTGNYDVIALRNAYHGMSPATMGLTAHSTWKFNVPQGFGIHHALNPDPYRGVFGADAAKYAADVDDLLRSSTSGRVAGFIAETIQGVGGTVPLTRGYLPLVYESIRAAGGVCIADEVQTGFGRTGSHYWGFETQGVTPDIVTMAKLPRLTIPLFPLPSSLFPLPSSHFPLPSAPTHRRA